MKITKKHFIIGLALCCSSGVFAASKPGLWEATTNINMGGGMPQISPEQMEQMKSMGMKMPPMMGPTTIQYCLTPEMAARDTPPNEAEKQGCMTSNLKKSSKGMSADLVCDGKFKGNGRIEASYISDTSYTTRVSMHGVSARSPMPVDMTASTTGKWLSADCGTVKPAGQQ